MTRTTLWLDRRRGQSVVIPGDSPADDVVVTVSQITPTRVRLAFTANAQQAVHRLEVFEEEQRMQEETHGQSRS